MAYCVVGGLRIRSQTNHREKEPKLLVVCFHTLSQSILFEARSPTKAIPVLVSSQAVWQCCQIC